MMNEEHFYPHIAPEQVHYSQQLLVLVIYQAACGHYFNEGVGDDQLIKREVITCNFIYPVV
jgi:hypothetical protein